jgi:hypothetical protein
VDAELVHAELAVVNAKLARERMIMRRNPTGSEAFKIAVFRASMLEIMEAQLRDVLRELSDLRA